MKRRLALLITAAVMLAACSSGSTFDTTAASLSAGRDSVTPDQGQGQGNVDEFQLGAVPPTDRKVIYDATMQLEDAQTRATFDRLTALVQGSGGFVSAATVQEVSEEDEQPFISMTVRVPADRLTATLTAIRQEADRVVSESLSSQDVTEEFVD